MRRHVRRRRLRSKNRRELRQLCPRLRLLWPDLWQRQLRNRRRLQGLPQGLWRLRGLRRWRLQPDGNVSSLRQLFGLRD